MQARPGCLTYWPLLFVCPTEATISHKAMNTEAMNSIVRGTPGLENFITMHALNTMNVAAQTSSFAFVEDFKIPVHDAVRSLQFSFRTSFLERSNVGFTPTVGSWLGEQVETWSLKRGTQRTSSL